MVEAAGRRDPRGGIDVLQRAQDPAGEQPAAREPDHGQGGEDRARQLDHRVEDLPARAGAARVARVGRGERVVRDEAQDHVDAREDGRAGEQEEARVAERQPQPGAHGDGEPVARARHGDDQLGRAERLAQGGERDAWRGRARVDVGVPRLLEQRLRAHHAATGAHQQLEHGELLARELDVAPVAVGLAAVRVEAKVGELEHGWARRGRPAGQRAQAHHQLLEGERLGQVVVGAEREARDLVAEPARRGQHQDSHVGVLAGDRRADLVAVQAGEVAVEHDHVVVGEGDLAQRLVAVERDVGGDRLAPEARLQRLGQEALVLDDQDPHRSHSRRAGCCENVWKTAHADATAAVLTWPAWFASRSCSSH